MTEFLSTSDKMAQYDAPPASENTRFWMSVETWLEELPDNAPFFYWQTGSGCEYRVRPAERIRADELGITDKKLREMAAESDEVHDATFISNMMVCMLVDAPDETAAWDVVRQHFPDMRERFINSVPDKTLNSLAKSGRFEYPAADEAEPEVAAPRI